MWQAEVVAKEQGAQLQAVQAREAELEQQVTALTGQHNIHQRIQHHQKVKDENNALRSQVAACRDDLAKQSIRCSSSHAISHMPAVRCTYSFTLSFIRSLIRSHSRSLTHSPTLSFAHSLTHFASLMMLPSLHFTDSGCAAAHSIVIIVTSRIQPTSSCTNIFNKHRACRRSGPVQDHQ